MCTCILILRLAPWSVVYEQRSREETTVLQVRNEVMAINTENSIETQVVNDPVCLCGLSVSLDRFFPFHWKH